MYDPVIGRFHTLDPKAEKYNSWSPYNYTGGNPILRIDVNGEDWLKVTGNQIVWYGGKTGDEGSEVRTYKATSGATGYQKAKYQNKRNQGPTPEGLYSINLKPDPSRKAEVATNGQVKSNPEGGIENLVDMPVEGRASNVVGNSTDWGKNRAKLDPLDVTGANGTDRDNNSYYLHDSEKGYTSGCTETETVLFDDLKEYRNEGNEVIEVVVVYPDPEHSTNGGTKKEQEKEEIR
jgi:hypothetical protein